MMRRCLIAGALIAGACSIACVPLFIPNSSSGQEQQTGGVTPSLALPPAPVQPPNVVPLSTAEQLGKGIFFDKTLSNPIGLSCATCHLPSAGVTGESSAVNKAAGPMPGVVPGRFGHRKPQAVPYATFSPYGPYYSGDLQV